jgi:hypothetical protein
MRYSSTDKTPLPISEKKKFPLTKCSISLVRCLAKIELIYIKQAVSYWEFHAVLHYTIFLYILYKRFGRIALI